MGDHGRRHDKRSKFDCIFSRLAAPSISNQDAKAIAAVGVNALLVKRAASSVFRAPEADMQDEHYIAEWTAMLASRVEAVR